MAVSGCFVQYQRVQATATRRTRARISAHPAGFLLPLSSYTLRRHAARERRHFPPTSQEMCFEAGPELDDATRLFAAETVIPPKVRMPLRASPDPTQDLPSTSPLVTHALPSGGAGPLGLRLLTTQARLGHAALEHGYAGKSGRERVQEDGERGRTLRVRARKRELISRR